MGAIAEAIAAYAQPLLDQTDGSAEAVNRAFALGQLCWNLALLPEEGRDEALGKMRLTLKMDDDEFEAFRCSVVVPVDPAPPGDVPAYAPAGFDGTFERGTRAADAPDNAGAHCKITGDRASAGRVSAPTRSPKSAPLSDSMLISQFAGSHPCLTYRWNLEYGQWLTCATYPCFTGFQWM